MTDVVGWGKIPYEKRFELEYPLLHWKVPIYVVIIGLGLTRILNHTPPYSPLMVRPTREIVSMLSVRWSLMFSPGTPWLSQHQLASGNGDFLVSDETEEIEGTAPAGPADTGAKMTLNADLLRRVSRFEPYYLGRCYLGRFSYP